MNQQESLITNNFYIPGLEKGRLPWGEAATPLEKKETIYTDDEVYWLPFIRPDHPHYREWARRQLSSRRLVRYLVGQKKEISILEIGCGNGWFSFQLSTIPGSKVVGLDRDYIELSQAARVFRQQPNLKFIYGDLYSDILQGLTFDVIVLAGTLECFPSAGKVFDNLLPLLTEDGEIHILDSLIYRPEELTRFHPDYLHDPRSLWNRLFRRKEIWPWIRIKR